MFSYSGFSKCDLAGTIEVDKPIQSLGNIKDIHGEIWNINTIFNGHVCACRLSELHPYYSSTSTEDFGYVYQTWKPYKIKVANEKAREAK